jgi:hypothetical protein
MNESLSLAGDHESPLETFGFETFRSSSYRMISPPVLRNFQDYWNRLDPDQYLCDGGHYRRRRFGRFVYSLRPSHLERLPDGPFFQSRHHNPLHGGILRQFAPLEPGFAEHSLLHKMIDFHCRRIDVVMPREKWLVYVHQIRILASLQEMGHPSPEGLHQDGHDFVAQILINRSMVSGGASHIYENPKQKIYQQTLLQPLDSILVDDCRVWHFVTPIRPLRFDSSGYRDMLLIDFNPAEER